MFPIKKSQALALGMLIFLFGLALSLWNTRLGLIWFVGIGIGYTLYRSGFCFLDPFTDALTMRDFTMARALLIFISVSLAGISIYQYYSLTLDLPLPGRIQPVGTHTILGGVLFGLGMVLAGACASGTLQRLGEGFALALVILLGMMIGGMFGTQHLAWWVKNLGSLGKIYLPDYLGFGGAVLLSLGLLGGLFLLTYIWEQSSLGRSGHFGPKKAKSSG